MRVFLDASVLLAAAGQIYGLDVLLPYAFLERERATGRLGVPTP